MLLARLGRLLGFSPEGRRVRLWTEGRPGEEDSKVIEGTVVEVVRDVPGVTRASAVVQLAEPVRTGEREHGWVLAVPTERRFTLEALWFSFIAVDALPLDRGAPPEARWQERLGTWWMRLGRRAG